MLQIHIAALQGLLEQFLGGAMSRVEFVREFAPKVAQYRDYISDRPYYPLTDICEGTSFSYADFRKYCSEALERLPREELDRGTRLWIREALVDRDAFRFFKADGSSKFGASKTLYSSAVDGQSFLLSALNGTLRPLPFLYSDLLATLKEAGGGELAAWAFCCEPDGAFARIGNIWSPGNAYEEANQLAQLEQTRGETVQWGNCYLLLLPKSKAWMLVNYYHFRGLEIALHGAPEFVGAVLQRIEPNAGGPR